MELYVHIPFCVKKCDYCDFLSEAYDADIRAKYTDALCAEIRLCAAALPGRHIESVFIGGGTPSWLELPLMEKILDAIDTSFSIDLQAEYTIEVNPGTVDTAQFKVYRTYGINRISIGLQSANDDELKLLGRIHDYNRFLHTFEYARNAGFTDINIDIMTGLPGQTPAKLLNTIRQVTRLFPSHISAYALMIEEGTPFYIDYRFGQLQLPAWEENRRMYHYAVCAVKAAGYHHYEVSNAAKPGFECRHNLKYWLLEDYLGFGASAASNVGRQRFTLLPDAEGYIAALESGGELLSEAEELSPLDRAAEYVMLGLRTTHGIEKEEYERLFRAPFAPLETLLEGYLRLGLARQTEERWRFTPRGFLLSNQLIGELLDAQAEQRYRA